MPVHYNAMTQQSTHACVFICGRDSTKRYPRADTLGLKRFCELVQEQIFRIINVINFKNDTIPNVIVLVRQNCTGCRESQSDTIPASLFWPCTIVNVVCGYGALLNM